MDGVLSVMREDIFQQNINRDIVWVLLNGVGELPPIFYQYGHEYVTR